MPLSIGNATGWPNGLRSAEAIAEKIGFPAEKLIQLADTGFAPHWRIDNGPPLFQTNEIKSWLAQNALQREPGRRLEKEFGVITFFEPSDFVPWKERPKQLATLYDLRKISPDVRICSGVYFLCEKGLYGKEEVVYVGQSVNVFERIRQHKCSRFSTCYFLPVAPEGLNEVEGAFIRKLRPPQNVTGKGRLYAPRKETDDEKVIAEYEASE